jgi:hypothetical protein
MATWGAQFRLTLITADPAWAAAGDAAGINAIGVDLERRGKDARQRGLDTRLSDHTLDDLRELRSVVTRADRFVRINAWSQDGPAEVDAALEAGATSMMLPYFRTAEEVRAFVAAVDGRARTLALVETTTAIARIDRIAIVKGLDEVVIGLNDLRLELRVHNHFEVLSSPLLNMVAAEVHKAGRAFSVGGVGLPSDATVPVPPDLVLAQYPRLGATGAWLSRSFLKQVSSPADLASAVHALRAHLDRWAGASEDSLYSAQRELAQLAAERHLRS